MKSTLNALLLVMTMFAITAFSARLCLHEVFDKRRAPHEEVLLWKIHCDVMTFLTGHGLLSNLMCRDREGNGEALPKTIVCS